MLGIFGQDEDKGRRQLQFYSAYLERLDYMKRMAYKYEDPKEFGK